MSAEATTKSEPKTNDIDRKKKTENENYKEDKEDVKLNNKKVTANKKEGVQKIKPPAKKRVKEGNVDKEEEAKEKKDAKIGNAVAEESEKSSDDENEDEGDSKSVPLLDQPLVLSGRRVRKQVTRLTLDGNVGHRSKSVDLIKGSGTALGSIPRIEANIGRTNLDDLKVLHKICFGGRVKAMLIRKNIRQFNGFGYDKDSEDFEKKKAALSKLTVNELKAACSILDLEKSRKRDDLVEKVLLFLLKPSDPGKKVSATKAKKRNLRKNTKESDSKQEPKSARSARNKGKKEDSEIESSEDEEEEIEEKEETSDKEEDAETTEPEKDEDEEEEQEKEEDSKKTSARAKKGAAAKGAIKKQVEEPPKKRAAVKRPAAANKKVSESEGTEEEEHSEQSKSGGDDDSEETDEPPAVKKSKVPPTDEEIKAYVKSVLEGANLEEITMKTVCKQVYGHYPDFDLSHKKDFIKATVKSFLSS